MGGGPQHGLRACGYRAIDALRLEKGYRAWGTDITPEDDAGRGRPRVRRALDKDDFIGREATLAARAGGRSGSCAACGWPIRSRSASAPSRCAWTATWPAG